MRTTSSNLVIFPEHYKLLHYSSAQALRNHTNCQNARGIPVDCEDALQLVVAHLQKKAAW